MKKPINILLEGVGGVGKSTVAQYITSYLISRSTPFITHHFAYPRGDTYNEKAAYQQGQFRLTFELLDELNKKGISSLFDRSWVGEYVWGEVYRKQFPHYLTELEAAFSHQNTIIFLCTFKNPRVILKRLESRDEVIEKADPYFLQYSNKISAIIAMDNSFRAACNKSPFKSYDIYTDGDKLSPQAKNKIKKAIKEYIN